MNLRHGQDSEYDLIVIGGGSAGLAAAGIGATVGAKTVLIERDRLGGDCTWHGCIPSKTLLKAAAVAHTMRTADRYGAAGPAPAVDFQRVMQHVRSVRQSVYEHADRPERFEDMGVEVVQGNARFLNVREVEVLSGPGARLLRGRYFVIATGGRTAVPPIEGLADVPALTTETLFELTERPRRLGVLGAGPIGNELSQAFQRLGTEVTVIEIEDRIQTNDDAELAGMLRAHLEAEGVTYLLQANMRRVWLEGKEVVMAVERAGTSQTVRADALLIAAGRRPNVEDMNLEAAGVAYGSAGIEVDERCRTNRKHIYAVGDVTGEYHFSHMSEHMAKVAVANALLRIPKRIDRRHVPWVTFTAPELAQTGAREEDLTRRGAGFAVYRFPYSKLDRALTDGAETGLIKICATKRRGRILGVSILGAHAGELIGAYTLAMRHGISLRRISDTIHPYPTYSLGVRRAADQWYVRNYPHRLLGILGRIFRYRGTVMEYGPDEIV